MIFNFGKLLNLSIDLENTFSIIFQTKRSCNFDIPKLQITPYMPNNNLELFAAKLPDFWIHRSLRPS